LLSFEDEPRTYKTGPRYSLEPDSDNEILAPEEGML